MMLFYVDETGNRDPRLSITTRRGETLEGDWLYVTTAVGVFSQRWHTFEKTINRHKMSLIESVASSDCRLDLADCEIKSNWVRIPKERARHPFLSKLTDEQITELVDLYFEQLFRCKMQVLAVLVDKRHLPRGTTQSEIQRLSWQKLLDLVERLMRARHHKHQAIILNDDITPQENRRLAVVHSSLLDQGTDDGTWLRHICEMPMFVRSELSVGVQIADFCSYAIYRAFRDGNPDYPFFKRITPALWQRGRGKNENFPGLWVIGQGSPLLGGIRQLELRCKRGSNVVAMEPRKASGVQRGEPYRAEPAALDTDIVG